MAPSSSRLIDVLNACCAKRRAKVFVDMGGPGRAGEAKASGGRLGMRVHGGSPDVQGEAPFAATGRIGCWPSASTRSIALVADVAAVTIGTEVHRPLPAERPVVGQRGAAADDGQRPARRGGAGKD